MILHSVSAQTDACELMRFTAEGRERLRVDVPICGLKVDSWIVKNANIPLL